MKSLIAGNWKMNGVQSASAEIDSLIGMLGGSTPSDRDVLICPPTTLLASFVKGYSETGLLIGAQDCHQNPSGAHTGDLSAEMLADAGASYVIVGHSERRADHGEGDSIVRAKAEAVIRAGMTPIICIGETQQQRESNEALAVVGTQLTGSLPATSKPYIVAYEPVWAIGTGLTPTASDISEMHNFIRAKTPQETRILYGGSVKPTNAQEILAITNVNGALVGGASLKASDFFPIIAAAPGEM